MPQVNSSPSFNVSSELARRTWESGGAPVRSEVIVDRDCGRVSQGATRSPEHCCSVCFHDTDKPRHCHSSPTPPLLLALNVTAHQTSGLALSSRTRKFLYSASFYMAIVISDFLNVSFTSCNC